MKKLFHNATINLMNERNDTAIGMLVEKGKIIEVFMDQIPTLVNAEVVDLQKSHVYPGFIDTHTHSFEGGVYSQSLNLSDVKSMSEVLERISEYYRQCKKAGNEQVDVFRYDENQIEEKRFPSTKELDKTCPDLPLILRRIDGHSSVINTIAWQKFYDANRSYVDRTSHIIIKTNLSTAKHPEVLRGELNDKVVHWFLDNMSEQTILEAYMSAATIAVSKGITTVHAMVGDSQNSITHYSFLKSNLDKFPSEFIPYPQSFNLEAALDAGAERIGGCILADGSLGSYTAALREPYHDQPATLGLLYHDNAFWENFITKATTIGLQVGVHCIGDRAIKQINDVYLKLFRQKEHDLRHELIHCELTPDDLLEEIELSKAIPVMQPSFDLYWGGDSGFYQKVLGKERGRLLNRFRTFLNKGVPITGGSDWYITELDALQGIKAAIFHNTESEAVSPTEALKMYTINAAHLSHDENRLGRLKPGYDADFVCLTSSLLSKPGLQKTQVRSTYKKGSQVFSL